MILSWQYIAGFFDGEGHVSVVIKNNNVGLCQSGREGLVVLSDIAETCRASGIKCGVYAANESKRTGKPMYRLSVQGRECCRRFLIRVFPFLRVKRLAAQDALRHFTLYPPIYGGLQRTFIPRAGFFARRIWDDHTFTPRKAKKDIGKSVVLAA